MVLACYREFEERVNIISDKSVELGLKKLVDEGYIEKHGSGRGTFMLRRFENTASLQFVSPKVEHSPNKDIVLGDSIND